METEKKPILTDDEQLLDVALRGIGLQLPDEYVIRVALLRSLAKEKPLGTITLDDLSGIEREARKTVERRTAHADKTTTGNGEGSQEAWREESIHAVMREIDRIDEEYKQQTKKLHPNRFQYQKRGNAVRFRRCCSAANIETVGQLMDYTRPCFEKLPNMGRQCADVVSEAIRNLYQKDW